MTRAVKRTPGMPPDEVQRGNRAWWSDHPMAYDPRGEIDAPRLSRAWFDCVDARFVEAARTCATDATPFDRVLPLARLRGARVLDVGCGVGLHTELLARAGAIVTSIDLAPTSIEATRARLALKGLSADVREADAEHLPFPDRSFDFVWSWGVVHHSARTARIVRHLARVLQPDGEARVMVYNRDGVGALVAFVRDHLIRGGFLRGTVDETLVRASDGFSARFYARDQIEDLFRAFFADVTCAVLGQEADAVPLPRPLREIVAPIVPASAKRAIAERFGSFLFVIARRPE